jgi:mRNA interferase RelE/StbE
MHASAGAASLREYRLFETTQFQKDLHALARSGQARIVRQLREVVYPQLRAHPHFGPHIKKLRDYRPEAWRYRIGAWRFFYEIDEARAVVSMIAASHRGSAY